MTSPAYYKTHTLAGSADGTLTGFQVRVTCYKGSGTDSGGSVYLGTHVLDDFIDVRFKTGDGSTDLPFWRDQSQLVSGTSCVFWVKVPSIAADPATTDIRVYYGDALATTGDDIKSAMLDGDDFRSMRRTIQIASGAAPRWVNGVFHHSGDVIYHTLWDSSTLQHWLYTSTDGCATAPTSVSTIYSASSSRSHSNLTGDGSSTLWVAVKHSSGTGIYVKKSTNSGASWGSEVTVEASLTGVTDPCPLYVSGSQLLMFTRITSGGNNIIRCHESTDGGASWSTKGTVHSETSTGITGLEDLDAVLLPSGRIIVAWERETTELGEARCDYVYSDDDGATWSTVATIVNNASGVDDEGGSFAKRADGTIDYVFGSNTAGGTSYLKEQAWLTTYDEGADSWSTPVLVNESYDGVENNVAYDSNDVLVLFNTRQYAATGGDSTTYTATVTRLDGDDWSDRGATQDSGLAYVTSGGAWVEGFTLTGGERGFLPFDTYSGADAVVEMLASAPSPLTAVDLRMVLRYGSANDHYMLSLVGATTNQVQWYKRVSGTYTSLSTGSYTPSINTLYRIIATLRGTNPTTLTVTVNGSTVLSSVTEGTSSRTSGKIGVSAATTPARRATLARHIFARKYTANEPTHGAWGPEQADIEIACAVGNAAAAGIAGSATVSIDIAGAVGNAVAAGVTGAPAVSIGIDGVVGNAVAAGATGDASVTNDISIDGVVGNAVAAGVAGDTSVGSDISISGTVGNAVAVGVAGVPGVSTTISASVGNATAAGVSGLAAIGVLIDGAVGNATAAGITGTLSLDIVVAGVAANAVAAGVTGVTSVGDSESQVLSAPPIGHGPGMSGRRSNAGGRRSPQLNSRTR